MSPPRRTLLAALLLVPALLSAPAPAYVFLREHDGVVVKWNLAVPDQPNVDARGRITYYLDTRGSIDIPSGPLEVTAVRKAFETWAAVKTSAVDFVEDRNRSAWRQDSSDRVNLVRWDDSLLGPLTLGLTFPYSSNGVMTDADIILNDSPARAWRWETTTPGTEFAADVQAVMTHEIGHLLGLDHSPLGGSTLFFELPLGAIRFRTLQPDDVAGVTALYPAAGTGTTRGAMQGRATLKGRKDHRGVHIVVIDLFTRQPAAGALTLADGSWRVEGLPPGSYRVLALPLRGAATMVPYWAGTHADFRGRAFGTDGENPGRPALVRVEGGFTTFGIDFPDLPAGEDPREPNDTPATAVPIALNEVAFGTAETVKDEDWYRFTGSAGDRISIQVDSWHVGGDADVEVTLFAPDGKTLLARSQDIRPPLVAENRLGPLGADTDALIENRELPEDGAYTIRVGFAANSNYGGPLNFYVLALYADSGAPDPGSSIVRAVPPAVPGDGAWRTTILVDPRNLAGERLPPGLEVRVTGEGRGEILGPVTDRGDGTYSVEVRAPPETGEERFTVRVTSGTGRAVMPDAVTVRYLGPPDPERSDLFFTPGRIEADGRATAVLTLVARDARGVLYGPGLPVSFTPSPGPSRGTLGFVRDGGDGTYTAVITAPPEDGTDVFRASIAGYVLDLDARIHYGFALPAVILESRETAAGLLADPGLPRGVRKRIAAAVRALDRAAVKLGGGDPRSERRVLTLVSRTARSWKKARARGEGKVTLPGIDVDLAEAGRRHVSGVLSGILFNPPDPEGEERLDRARNALASGEESLLAGRYDRALKSLARALRIAAPLR